MFAASPLPPLNPGKLPASYFDNSDRQKVGPSRLRDPEVERAEKAALLAASAPAPPEGPPELMKNGKPLTKRQKKEVSCWFWAIEHQLNFSSR
jgi:hypothetical protein